MKRIISVVCILLLQVATSNLTVKIHFCTDKVSSIIFFGKSKTCGDSCDTKQIAAKLHAVNKQFTTDCL